MKLNVNEAEISQNKTANAGHYPRATGPILGYDLTRTPKSLVDSAAPE